MSCDTCQDCGCDNITLPVATGATGATGAAGAAGANGTNGAAILHNDVVQSTTASATIALFSTTKAYTLPAGTLGTNGSKLSLTAIFSTTGSTAAGNSFGYIYFAGSSFTAKTFPFNIQYYKETAELMMNVTLEITRVSATDLFVTAKSIKSPVSTGGELGSYSFFESSITVADLDVNSLLIEARGKTAGTTTFNCDQLCIEHLIK